MDQDRGYTYAVKEKGRKKKDKAKEKEARNGKYTTKHVRQMIDSLKK